ncbi:hypothetical protein AKJ09_09684 [Labilithrix luteola]|uniref:Uncharacterized protein n=1 Tax=Labilithrix luteola TaxID=1391654 RepID=A0A0K1QB55_9BACT|nr:hypothetical protein AKJ09_09684 [Labilithrix luteola]
MLVVVRRHTEHVHFSPHQGRGHRLRSCAPCSSLQKTARMNFAQRGCAPSVYDARVAISA